MKRALLALFVAASLHSPAWAGPERAEVTGVYRVVALSGTVLTREPNGSRWIAVARGSVIPDGQILQVTTGARISLKRQGSSEVSGLAVDESTLSVTTPMILRVEPGMLRKVKLTEHFLKTLPEIVQAEPEKNTFELFFDEAWNRVAAIFSQAVPGGTIPSSQDLKTLEKQGMSLSVSSRKLRLLTPATNAILNPETLPTEIAVSWTPAEGNEKTTYKVYAWNTNQQRGEALAVTDENHYMLGVPAPGSYFVQVISADGKWQSVARPLHIAPPVKGVVRRGEPKQPSAAAVSLSFPPPAFQIFAAKGESPVVDFYWSRPLAADGKAPPTRLILRERSSGHVRRLAARKDRLTLRLEPGVYEWHVESGTAKNLTKSERRELEVHDPRAAFDVARLRALLAPGEGGTVYLTNGL